jgi:hypothetical protein
MATNDNGLLRFCARGSISQETTGIELELDMSTVTTGKAIQLDLDALTTGTGLEVRADSDNVTTGYFLRLLTGASMASETFSITADATPIMTYKSSDAGALGPVLKIEHDSASPADNDVIARHSYYSDDSGGASSENARLDVVITDVTATSEDAEFQFSAMTAGSLAKSITIDGAGLVAATGKYIKVDASQLYIGGTAITSNATELNTLDGLTASTAELNILDGVTANTTEINYLDGAAGVVVAGAAAGYKIARGSTTLDGANPTSVSHGLSTVVAHCVAIDSTVAPNDPSTVTSAVSGSTLNIYAWKPTSAGTTTLVASTVTTVNVEWVCVGT